MIIIRAITAMIHACLKALAMTALAMTSLLVTSVVLVVGGLLLLGVLGAGGAGGFRLVKGRRKQDQEPNEKP